MSPVLTGHESSVVDLLSPLFGQELKRRYNLRQMPNEDILDKYKTELQLILHSEGSREDYIALLDKFMAFLGEDRPSVDLAKEFIARYSDHSLNTQAKYATIIKNFMKYYGEPVEDLKIEPSLVFRVFIFPVIFDIHAFIKAFTPRNQTQPLNLFRSTENTMQVVF